MERLIDAGGARDGHRPGRDAQAQPHQAGGDALQDRVGHDLRLAASSRALLDKALKLADVDGFAARKEESKARGKLRGLGIGDYLEVTAPPMNEMGGLRFEPNGDVTIITGTLDYGQGHWSAFAQVLTTKLGIPFHKIKLIQGDSDLLIAGGGTGGSKSIMASGAAIVEASDKVIDKGKQIAGVALEASAADIEFQRRPLHHRRHRPRHRHHGAGREAAQRHEAARGRARHARTSATSTRRRRRPSPTARMSARSRSIPTPASSTS